MQNQFINELSSNAEIFRAIGDALMNQEIEIYNIPIVNIQSPIDDDKLFDGPVSAGASTIIDMPVDDNDLLCCQEPVDSEIEEPEPKMIMSRRMDSAICQLGSGQDLVYSKERVLENGDTEWLLAVFDGHGSHMGFNPFTNRFEKFCLPLCILQDLIEQKLEETEPKIDALLSKDIFDENEDPALALQRAIGKAALNHKINILHEGATMVLVKVRHSNTDRNITVDVLSVGDSTAVIHCNGEKVFHVAPHPYSNEEEIERLKAEGRFERTEPARGFKIIGDNKLVSIEGLYVMLKNGAGTSMTQTLGHIQTLLGKIIDERGSFGLAPFKQRMVFSDEDELNIKLFSDGVSDVIAPDIIPLEAELLCTGRAHEIVEHTRLKWHNSWKMCSSEEYKKCISEGGSIDSLRTKTVNFGKGGSDDVSCVAWIQKKST